MAFKEITVKENLVYKTKIFDLYENDVKLQNDTIAKRALIKHNGAVCLIIEHDDKLVFVNQFRQGPQCELLELVAGKLEKDEDPKECAIRELEEETGYIVDDIKYFGKIIPLAAYSSEIIHCFLVKVSVKKDQHLDEDEFLEVIEIPYEKALEMYLNSEFTDGKTLGFLGKYFLEKNNTKNKYI